MPIRSGIIMASHLGCGTWRKRLWNTQSGELSNNWTRCSVDECNLVQDACFCIPESQTWELIPLSASFLAKSQAEKVGDGDILLLSACCGRFILLKVQLLLHQVCVDQKLIADFSWASNQYHICLITKNNPHFLEFEIITTFKSCRTTFILYAITLSYSIFILFCLYLKWCLYSMYSLCKYLMVASGRASVFIIHVKTGKLIKVICHIQHCQC